MVDALVVAVALAVHYNRQSYNIFLISSKRVNKKCLATMGFSFDFLAFLLH